MRKVAIIFVVAVILPSGALAWLALRSLHDEQLIIRARQTQLYQAVADSFAKQAQNYVSERQREFGSLVEGMLASVNPSEVANTFDERIRKVWPLANVGFAVTLEGTVHSPNMLGRPEGRRFRVDNDKFLCSRESIEVYVSTPKGSISLNSLDEMSRGEEKVLTPKKARILAAEEGFAKGDSLSKLTAAETSFRDVVGGDNDGVVARFLQNQLHVMIWHRPPRDVRIVFGARIDLDRVAADLRELLAELEPNLRGELCVAILNDAGRVAARSDPAFVTDWKHPQAASEIGETLPHWEVAVYARNPLNLQQTAARVRWTVGLLIAVLIAAIATGGLLVLLDLRRQLELARQKSDFVSNVSHELKTPLTSIRMFSELLAEGRVCDPEKQSSYLKIIGAETARLTRLINNVLDFARMEKGEKKYRFEDCDFAKIVAEALENYRAQLEAHGFTIETAISAAPLIVRGDCDALAQVALNLFSNAEKYAGERKEIRVELKSSGSEVELSVLDRGLGVPKGAEEKIFEQFYRAHDSLSSGIQGSGLGLTLARQIVRAHAGEICCEERPGGGSIFIVTLPMGGSR